MTASGTPDAPITIASYGKGPATIQAGDSYGIRLLNCQHIEVRDLVLLGSGVKANGQTTNTAQGLDIFSTATRGKPWQSIRADGLVVSGFREGIVLHTPIGTQDVVGYNNVRITHCTTRECLFGGIYCWAQEDQRAAVEPAAGQRPIHQRLCRRLPDRADLLRSGRRSAAGAPHPGPQHDELPGRAVYDPRLRPGRQSASIAGRHRRAGVPRMRQVRGPVQ